MRVVVVGGGIIGCLTALMLKQRGAEPIVLERGAMGRESSWAGAGILCPIHPWLYPDSFSRLVLASLQLYPELMAELERHSGVDVQWRQTGMLIPFFADDRHHYGDQAMAWSQRMAWRAEVLSAAQSVQQEPSLSAAVRSSVYWPEVAQVRNPCLLDAIRICLKKHHIPMREHVEVRALQRHDGQRVTGVQLADGSSIEADAVLLAAGSWSGALAKQWGISLPIQPVKGQIVLLRAKPNTVRSVIKHDSVYVVPRVDGRILLGASMEHVGFLQGNTVSVVSQLLQSAQRLLPGLADCEIEKMWMGFRPGSPDGMPFMGALKSVPGLWVASGHYRNGVALAPITAQCLSDAMMGHQPAIDLHDFRCDRVCQQSHDLGYNTS